jgi:hypothetical protein
MTNLPNDERKNSPESKAEYPMSPVPGDASLPEDELPFTAFGQFGADSLDLRVFEQDKYWVNREGKPFLLEEMDRDYLLNVMTFLFDGASYFHLMMLRKTVIEVLSDALNGVENPEILAVQTSNSISDVEPVQWLNSTPLVRKLNKLLGW